MSSPSTPFYDSDPLADDLNWEDEPFYTVNIVSHLSLCQFTVPLHLYQLEDLEDVIQILVRDRRVPPSFGLYVPNGLRFIMAEGWCSGNFKEICDLLREAVPKWGIETAGTIQLHPRVDEQLSIKLDRQRAGISGKQTPDSLSTAHIPIPGSVSHPSLQASKELSEYGLPTTIDLCRKLPSPCKFSASSSSLKHMANVKMDFAEFPSTTEFMKSFHSAVHLYDPHYGNVVQSWLDHPMFPDNLEIYAYGGDGFAGNYKSMEHFAREYRTAWRPAKASVDLPRRFVVQETHEVHTSRKMALHLDKESPERLNVKKEPAMVNDVSRSHSAEDALARLRTTVYQLRGSVAPIENGSIGESATFPFSEKARGDLRERLANLNVFSLDNNGYIQPRHAHECPEDNFVDDNINRVEDAVIVKTTGYTKGIARTSQGELGLPHNNTNAKQCYAAGLTEYIFRFLDVTKDRSLLGIRTSIGLPERSQIKKWINECKPPIRVRASSDRVESMGELMSLHNWCKKEMQRQGKMNATLEKKVDVHLNFVDPQPPLREYTINAHIAPDHKVCLRMADGMAPTLEHLLTVLSIRADRNLCSATLWVMRNGQRTEWREWRTQHQKGSPVITEDIELLVEDIERPASPKVNLQGVKEANSAPTPCAPSTPVREPRQLAPLDTPSYLAALSAAPNNTKASSRLLQIIKDESVHPVSSLGIKLLDLVKDLCNGGDLEPVTIMLPTPIANPAPRDAAIKAALEPIDDRLNEFANMLNTIAGAVGIDLLEDVKDGEKSDQSQGVPGAVAPSVQLDDREATGGVAAALAELRIAQEEVEDTVHEADEQGSVRHHDLPSVLNAARELETSAAGDDPRGSLAFARYSQASSGFPTTRPQSTAPPRGHSQFGPLSPRSVARWHVNDSPRPFDLYRPTLAGPPPAVAPGPASRSRHLFSQQPAHPRAATYQAYSLPPPQFGVPALNGNPHYPLNPSGVQWPNSQADRNGQRANHRMFGPGQRPDVASSGRLFGYYADRDTWMPSQFYGDTWTGM